MVTHDEVRQNLILHRYDEARNGALELVSINPLDAQGWVFLGEACLRSGNGTVARRCFDRAWLLDPEAKWVSAMQKACEDAPSGTVTDHEVEKVLAYPSKTVSALILFKNNKRTLSACLAALQRAVDEIIAVDTGSSDGSREIAEMYGAKVYDFPWIGDFSAARNFGLKYVSSDWVIAIDSDEILELGDQDNIRITAGLFHELQVPAIVRIVQMNKLGRIIVPALSQSRMFPMNKGLHWDGKIHEVITFQEFVRDRRVVRPAVRIRVFHDGYDPESVDIQSKYDRNITLLLQQLQQEPDNPSLHFFIGRESLFLKRYDVAIKHLEEAERLGQKITGYGMVPDIMRRLVQAYAESGNVKKAEQKAEEMISLFPTYPDGLFLRAEIRIRKIDQEIQKAYSEMLSAQKAANSYRGITETDSTIGTWKSEVYLADIARWLGRWDEARARYVSAISIAPELMEIRKRIDEMDRQIHLLSEATTQN